MTKNNGDFEGDIGLQSWLRPAITAVRANLDHERFALGLEGLSRALPEGGLERGAVRMGLSRHGAEGQGKRHREARQAIFALRVQVLRHVLGDLSLRDFSCRLSQSDLLGDFVGVRTLEGIRGVSKSTLERATRYLPEEGVRELVCTLLERAGQVPTFGSLGLAKPVDRRVELVDGTCLPAHIHYPVGSVLLKDFGHSLLHAIALIRKRGLRQCMPQEPAVLARDLNRLCLRLTYAGRKGQAQRLRKGLFRELKGLVARAVGHARRHAQALDQNWGESGLSRPQVEQRLRFLRERLALWPRLVWQAHERLD